MEGAEPDVSAGAADSLEIDMLTNHLYDIVGIPNPVCIEPQDLRVRHRRASRHALASIHLLRFRAATSVGIHFGTFHLADDGQDEPAMELRRAVEKAGEPRPRFWALEFGEGRDVP